MVSFSWIRNAFALAGITVLIVLFLTMYRANALHENVQGTWINNECFTITYTFIGNYYYINGVKIGVFRINGSHITFSGGARYHIRVHLQHNSMILDGIQYLRMW